MKPISPARQHEQKGSALLIVLVFAAVVAIMLYREMPIAAFEAQRQKEELLVSRGNEYKRGVKLFVRKVGRFPTTIAELESTNRMRFLRHRYVDPLTGKDDWRMIHAGPGGVITDSKVQTTQSNGTASTLGQGAVFAGFNNSFNGDTTAAAAEQAGSQNPGLRQRPPATQNAGTGVDQFGMPLPPGTTGDPSAPNQNPALNLDPTTGQPIPGNAAAVPGNAASAPLGPGGNGNGVNTAAQQLNIQNPQMPERPSPNQNTNTPGTSSAFGNTSAFGATSPTGITSQTGNNQLAAGGIAGVASNAEGKSIKTVNDQTKYKLWEFFYDMKKDQTAGAAGQQQQPGQPGVQQSGQQQNNPNSGSSAFGQSSFGQSSGTNSGGGFFNSAPTSQSAPPQPPPQPPLN